MLTLLAALTQPAHALAGVQVLASVQVTWSFDDADHLRPWGVAGQLQALGCVCAKEEADGSNAFGHDQSAFWGGAFVREELSGLRELRSHFGVTGGPGFDNEVTIREVNGTFRVRAVPTYAVLPQIGGTIYNNGRRGLYLGGEVLLFEHLELGAHAGLLDASAGGGWTGPSVFGGGGLGLIPMY